MPGSVFRTNLAVPISAPVLPADTQAWARPAFTRSMATRMEECFLVRIAVRTSSLLPTTSVAATTVRRDLWGECARASSRSRGSFKPTSRSSASGFDSRKSRQAGTVTGGPWSPPIASTAMTAFIASYAMRDGASSARAPVECFSVLGLHDLLAAVDARRRDVVAQVRLARRGLDRHRGLAEVVVRPVHAALRRRLLVLLNGHGSVLLSLFLLEGPERRERRFLPHGVLPVLPRRFQPRLAGHHRQRQEDRVLHQVTDVQGLIGDEVIFRLALLLDRWELRLGLHEHEALLDRNVMPEGLEARLARE